MRILLIHRDFVDFEHPGSTRHLELAQRLSAAGHRFTIIASSIDCVTGRTIRNKRSSRAVCGGADVVRALALPTFHHSYLSHMASSVCFMLTSTWAGLRAGPADVVVATSPPLFQVLSSWLVARSKGGHFVLEIRGLWPDFAVQLGVLRRRLAIAMARWIERFVYQQADQTIVSSPGYVPYLIDKGVPRDRISVVPDGTEPDMFDPSSCGTAVRNRFQLTGKFVAVYAGALEKANDLDVIVRAAELLRTERDVRILIVGNGKEAPGLQETVKRLELHHVILAGPVPKRQLAQVLAAADVCLATLRPIPLSQAVYPEKVFDYMAAGRPTILAIDGSIRRVIEQSGGGLFVPPGDERPLAEAIRWYQQHPDQVLKHGAAAREFVVQHFAREKQAQAFLQCLEYVATRRAAPNLYRRCGKRIVDVACAAAALVLLSPLIGIIALTVRWRLGKPILFRQQRAGLRGKVFVLYKFRTMREERDPKGQLLPDRQRLTRFGQWLRSLSLDELPQLWNVLRGDMSLVGPRPLLVQYLPRYTPQQARRHEVRPGITGLTQVQGRNALDWNEKFRLDVNYVDHVSLWLDLNVLVQTVLAVVKRRGISADGHVTMPEFLGSPDQAMVGQVSNLMKQHRL